MDADYTHSKRRPPSNNVNPVASSKHTSKGKAKPSHPN